MIDIEALSRTLRLGADGIWYSTESRDISYPSHGNENCAAVEDSSFWFKHRNDCIVSLVKSFPPRDKGPIFDIGGGNGFVSMELVKQGFDAVLLEPGKAGASQAKERGLKHIICATTETAHFNKHSLNAVGLFDVIEHIENDSDFLQSIRDLLKSGARIYATVPASPFLWSSLDIHAGHFRRYTVESFTKLFKLADFDVEFCSYIFRFLPIPIFLKRSLPYRLGLASKIYQRGVKDISRDHAVSGGIKAKIFNLSLQSEINRLNNAKPISFGSSCILVAKRK